MSQTGGKWKKEANKRKHNRKRMENNKKLWNSERLKELLNEQRRGD